MPTDAEKAALMQFRAFLAGHPFPDLPGQFLNCLDDLAYIAKHDFGAGVMGTIGHVISWGVRPLRELDALGVKPVAPEQSETQ